MGSTREAKGSSRKDDFIKCPRNNAASLILIITFSHSGPENSKRRKFIFLLRFILHRGREALLPEMEHFVMGSGSSCPFFRHHGSCSKRAWSWFHPLNDRIHVTCENYPGGSDVRGKDELEVLQDENLQGLGQHRGSTSNIALQARVVYLEHQVMLVRNENMDIKRALTRLYTLAEATHTEVKTHNRNLEDRVNVLIAAMLPNPLMKPLLEAPSNSTGNLGKKMENFGSTLVNSGLFFSLSSARERIMEKFEELSP